jgi:hypothetical protein
MANRFEFERWVPLAARRELESLAEQGIGDYSLLDRLATYQVMRDDVWPKVPAEKADIVIRQVWAIATVAGAWKTLHRVLGHIPYRAIKDAARYAKKLLHAMKQANGDLSLSWHLWPGDQQIMTSSEFLATLETARSAVDNLATFYSRADEQYKELIKVSNGLSWVLRKKNKQEAQEIFFQRWLMNRFQAEFGKPLDTVVMALSSVVFDQDEGVASSTIRGRRRSAPGAAHSHRE